MCGGVRAGIHTEGGAYTRRCIHKAVHIQGGLWPPQESCYFRGVQGLAPRRAKRAKPGRGGEAGGGVGEGTSQHSPTTKALCQPPPPPHLYFSGWVQSMPHFALVQCWVRRGGPYVRYEVAPCSFFDLIAWIMLHLS